MNLIYLYQKDSVLLDFVFPPVGDQIFQGQVAFDSKHSIYEEWTGGN